MADLIQNIILWGYGLLLNIETFRNPVLDFIFPAVTELGSEKAYIVIVALIYWCIDKPLGRAVAYMYLSSSWLNLFLKDFLGFPRPDSPALNDILERNGITQRLNPLMYEATCSLPSNHAQGTLVTWGYLAYKTRWFWMWFTAVVLIILIGFSRLYVGVHFPQDIIAGWIIGLIILCLWLSIGNKIQKWFDRIPHLIRIMATVCVPLALLITFDISEADKVLGSFAGLSLGYILEKNRIRFDVRGSVWNRILRGFTGLIIVFCVLSASKLILGSCEAGLTGRVLSILVAICYFITGFFASFVVPWVFLKIKLAEKEA